MSEHQQGPLPSRSTMSLTLSWGLISIPCSVFAGADKGKAINRSQFTPAGNPVGYLKVDKVTGETVEPGDIVHKYQVEPDLWVELTDEEIDAVATGPEPGLATIASFIPLATLTDGTYRVTSHDQLRPATVKSGRVKVPDPGATKAFSLLRRAMEAEGVAALVHFSSRGKPRYAAVTPDGRILGLAFADQVRQDLDLEEAEVSDTELDMARQLVNAVGVATPVLVDETGEAVAAYAASKADPDAEVVALPVAEPVAAPLDLTAALAASLGKAS